MEEALEFHCAAFRILCVEMIDPVFGILFRRRFGISFEFLIHPIHVLFLGVEKGDGAAQISFFPLAEAYKQIPVSKNQTAPLVKP